MLDMAVVGSGIGGSLISALNRDKNLILFEKDKNLGGCASTFKRKGNHYNSGATTFVGYEDGHIIKKQFDSIGVNPDISKSEIAIRVIQNDTVIDRTTDFNHFLEQIESTFPNRNNLKFWKTLKELDEKFWQLQQIYFGKYSFSNYKLTFSFIMELFKAFKLNIFKSANSFIEEILDDISKEYRNFIDAGLLITVQSDSNNISLLSLALGLCYPFHDVYYANGGMGSLIEEIVKDIEVQKNHEIKNIIQEKDGWIIESDKNSYKTKKLILNSSIYQTSHLFKESKIKSYYESFPFSDQSAFVIYLTVDSSFEFLEHYQLIFDDHLPNCISNSFFISFSKKDDPILSKNGYSVTISTHTKANFWKKDSKEEYENRKEETTNAILNIFLAHFTQITKEKIISSFSATSFTFNRYINRYNCGGKPITFKNATELPSCNTPFKGLYNVGDTVFAGQGWPGVALGVEVLQKHLQGE